MVVTQTLIGTPARRRAAESGYPTVATKRALRIVACDPREEGSSGCGRALLLIARHAGPRSLRTRHAGPPAPVELYVRDGVRKLGGGKMRAGDFTRRSFTLADLLHVSSMPSIEQPPCRRNSGEFLRLRMQRHAETWCWQGKLLLASRRPAGAIRCAASGQDRSAPRGQPAARSQEPPPQPASGSACPASADRWP